MTEDGLLAELRALRDRVAGITESALASLDGLIIRADTVAISPDNIAALAAASHGLAQRMACEARKGALREAMTRGSDGCVAVYPVGAVTLLAVVGDEGLDPVRLYRESRATVENLEGLLTGRVTRGKPPVATS